MNGAGKTLLSGEISDDEKLILLMAGLAAGARIWADWRDAASTDLAQAEQITNDPGRLDGAKVLAGSIFSQYWEKILARAETVAGRIAEDVNE